MTGKAIEAKDFQQKLMESCGGGANQNEAVECRQMAKANDDPAKTIHNVVKRRPMSCEFITQLKKLRKSAPEAIDDANSLDPFKAYLHVENEVE